MSSHVLSLTLGLGVRYGSGTERNWSGAGSRRTGSGSTSCVASKARFLSSQTGAPENNGGLTHLKRKEEKRSDRTEEPE